MNEDEAFIRAIVDNRGDETARLVYADWLDDRDDPRGPYLRAEAKWVCTGKKEKALRALAATLDPVWVARVSRPPVGICADKIAMRTEYPPVTAADLDAVEQQLEAKLPAEYRALLMNWNGASPSINVPRQPGVESSLSEIKSFAQVTVGKKRRGRDDKVDLLAVVQSYRRSMSELREGIRAFFGDRPPTWFERRGDTTLDFIPIAYGDDYGYYMLGVRGKVIGKVAWIIEYGHEGHGEVDDVCAPSLGALLASIIEEAPEWYRLIRNGDTAELFAWVDAGGDVNARYTNAHDDTECLLTLAIGEKNPTLVRELRARGAKVTRAIRKRAEYLQGWDKRKMLAALDAKLTPKKGKK